MKWTITKKAIAAALVALPVVITLYLMFIVLHGPITNVSRRSKATGDLKVVAERIVATEATPQFKFETVPTPVRPNAATSDRFTLVTGGRDLNGAPLGKLQSGFLPSGPDAPHENFFFKDGADGGRIGVDLNQAMDIQQVNTYSWHTTDRGPQVYKLYASDGTAAGFNPGPGATLDPLTVGWKLLASVDTRPKSGAPGGQYGVSITSPGGIVGHYRYLLFDCKRTEDVDRWVNTFYSEIDIVAK